MMHKLKLTATTAKTACGIWITAYYPQHDQALPAEAGPLIDCTDDPVTPIDCPKCLAAQVRV